MILELKNVSFTYHSKDNETKAVDKMSFGVEEGTRTYDYLPLYINVL